MPTIIIQPEGLSGKDTHVKSVPNNLNNYGGSVILEVGRSASTTARSLLHFDLSSIPVDCEITTANLFLHVSNAQNASVSNFDVLRINSSWAESEVYWDSTPSFSLTDKITFQIGNVGTVASVNVAKIVQLWVDGTYQNNGMLIKHADEMSTDTWKQITSSDNGTVENRPKLIVTYQMKPTAPIVIKPNGGERWDSSNAIVWNASNDAESPSNGIRYHIQLTLDNGKNWSDIAPLTTAGVTSYLYDFINKPETSMAKIRVRAYDGSAYGKWDESDGVFTIHHNVAPTFPTNLSPKGIPVDRLKTTRLTWQHNDSPNDIQSKADIQWRRQGVLVWYTITSEGTDQEYFISPNTFSNGQIEWQVRTYDSSGQVSPWSNTAVFTVAEAANVPTIIQPSESANVARPLIEWTSVSQTSYQLVVEDSLGVSIWDTGEISTNVRARTVGVDLLNGGTYKVKVRVKDGSGLFSSFAERTFLVSYTPPANPTVNTFEADGFIAFNIGTPTPTGTQPSVESYEIYKRINDVWTRIAYGVGSSFNDYHVRSGVTYEYYVKAIALNGTTSNSDIVSQSTTFRGSWIHTLQDAEASLQYFRYNGTGYETYYEPDSAVMKFAGRTRPVVHFGNYEEFTLTVRIQSVEGMSDMDVLRRFVRDRETVCYRDADGNLIVGHILALSVEKEYRVSSATITIVESDFNEGV